MDPWDETLDITDDPPDVVWLVGFDRRYDGPFAPLARWEAWVLNGSHLWPNLTYSTLN